MLSFRAERAPLDRQAGLLAAAVRRAYDDEEDVVAALTPDTEGIGSGADVTTAPSTAPHATAPSARSDGVGRPTG